MPDINAVTRGLAIAVTGLASLLCAVYALTPQKRGAKRALRGYEAIAFLWLMVIYIAAASGSTTPALLNGLFTRTAVIALTGLFVGEILSDWRLK